ncbi:hypothetical protein BASA61_005032 [Batrachochytrium salamandrivorans]|nr:hypothetical protein BASA61_005032 [Batrachochytrium salamandrivorans]
MRSFSIFALVCAAVFGSASGTFLDFDPPNLTLDDSELFSSFSCKLNKQPAAPVTVYFEHLSILFSECSLIFSPENWNVARTLNVTTSPVLEGFIGGGTLSDIPSEVVARAVTSDQVFQDSLEAARLKVNRKPATSNTCTSIGDPHYQTFDGLIYSTHSVGNYHLLNTPDFEVQTIIQLCTGLASCNGAVAVRYGATVMVIDVRGEKKDLSAYTMQQVTTNTNGVVYTPPPTGSGSHTIKLPCGSTVTIVAADQLGVARLDVTLTLTSGYRAPGGLCNKLPAQSTKKLVGADGSSGSVSNTDEINVFAKSWIVDPKNSLFEGSFHRTLPQISAIGTICRIPANPQPIAVPAPPPVPPTLPEYKLPVPVPTYRLPGPASSSTKTADSTMTSESTSTSASESVLPTSVPTTDGYTPPPPPPPEVLAEIEKSCKALFDIPGCNKIVPADFFIQSCILDAKLSGSYVFSEGGKRAYLAKCNSATKYMETGPTQIIIDQGIKVRQECGFGNRTCINDCSGNGACTNFGCACKVGFAGLDCSMDLSKARQLDPVTNIYKIDVKIQVIVQYQQKQVETYQPYVPVHPKPSPAASSGTAPEINTYSKPRPLPTAPAVGGYTKDQTSPHLLVCQWHGILLCCVA